MSESDVIRLVFRMSAVEKKSCRVIAVRLNQLRVPCAYVRDDRLMLRGKRKPKTAGVWRPGRIRGLLTNKTYMGVHEFGKRTTSKRPIVERPVPAIVSDVVWKKAQASLKAHMLFGKRNARNRYLLRGLIKCALCGLTYVGIAANRQNGKRESYYKCNGTHSALIFAKLQQRCTAKSIRGDLLEEQVWSDVQTFLRNPGPVLTQLHSRLTSAAEGADKVQHQVRRLEGLVSQKASERTRVVGLFRRGRLTDAQLDAQMDEIGKEEAALQTQIEELGARVASADSIDANIGSAEALLAKLRKRLDEPVLWEQKRQLIETLVAGVRVETFEQDGVKQTRVTVTYRFSEPDQPMPLVLPQTYASNGIRIPIQPVTVGDHIRRRRLQLKMLQRDVARQIGVTPACVFNWEGNTSTPHVKYMPAVIRFLGYNPLPEVTSLADRLVRHRKLLGMTQRAAAEP